MSKEMEALKRVVRDWGIIEVFLFVGFFPFSLLYVGIRVIQEFDNDSEDEEN